jgi:hypothetical protein
MFFSVDGGGFQIQLWYLSEGPPSTCLSFDGGRSRIYNFDTSQGTRRRRFLAWMVDAARSTAPTPPRKPVVDVFYVDGGVLLDLHQHLSGGRR